jgi:hypothetical protein
MAGTHGSVWERYGGRCPSLDELNQETITEQKTYDRLLKEGRLQQDQWVVIVGEELVASGTIPDMIAQAKLLKHCLMRQVTDQPTQFYAS